MKKIKIIALVGKAGSGKDYWLKQICENFDDVHEIISCTTRPKRFGEVEDINYHYLSDEQFRNEKFVESCSFNGWYYGTRYTDLNPNKLNVGVFNLTGIETLLRNPDIDLTLIYLMTEDKLRLIRQLERDASDIDEILRRYNTDKQDFNESRLEAIKNQVSDYYWVINNSTNEYDDNVYILRDIEEIIQKVKNK